MRNWLEMNPSTLVLARNEIASLRFRGRACRISCMDRRRGSSDGDSRLEIHTAARVKARALFPLPLGQG